MERSNFLYGKNGKRMEKMENIYFHMIFHMVFLGKKSKHMEIIWKKSILPSGKRLRDYVKSYFLMGKSTISMGHGFNSELFIPIITRGYRGCIFVLPF